MSDFKVGDRVAATYEGVIREIDDWEPRLKIYDTASGQSRWSNSGKVEKLEPVGPAADPVGTRRQGIGWGTWIKTYRGWALIDDRYTNRGSGRFTARDHFHLMDDEAMSGQATEVVA